MKYNIGDEVVDEDGNLGIVVIKYYDGDLCFFENDAAHPNPKPINIKEKAGKSCFSFLRKRAIGSRNGVKVG